MSCPGFLIAQVRHAVSSQETGFTFKCYINISLVKSETNPSTNKEEDKDVD